MAGWVTLWLGSVALLGVLVAVAVREVVAVTWLAALLAALVVVPLAAFAGTMVTRRWSHTIAALRDGVSSLRDRDFSVSITHSGDDELGELVKAYNGLGDRLRVERQSL